MGLFLVRNDNRRLMAIAYGYTIEWAAIYVIAIPLILKGRTLTKLVSLWIPLLVGISIISLIIYFIEKSKAKSKIVHIKKEVSKETYIYLLIFLVLLLYILYKAIFYTYADGDDAFYIGVAEAANISDKMYLCDPYLGDALYLDNIPYRYALSPFPMWIACIARFTNVPVAITAHTVMAPLLIIVSVIIYSEFSKKLYEESYEKQALFMLLISVWVMFSNVSTSMPETFMITRSRQGKAALANVILPLAILVLYELIRCINEEKIIPVKVFAEMFILSIAASLTSLFGNVLLLLVYAFAGLFFLIKRVKIRYILLLIVASLPNFSSVLLYYMLGR